jgi:hypothetical protein
MALIFRRGSASCPADGGSTHTTTNGQQYEIYCNVSFLGDDLPSYPAESFEECIEACDNYIMDPNNGNGAACVAAVYGANNPNGNKCYLKFQITDVNDNDGGLESARRVQYPINGDSIFSVFSTPQAPFPTPPPTPVVRPSSATPTQVLSPAIAILPPASHIAPGSPAVSLAASPAPTPVVSSPSQVSISSSSGTSVVLTYTAPLQAIGPSQTPSSSPSLSSMSSSSSLAVNIIPDVLGISTQTPLASSTSSLRSITPTSSTSTVPTLARGSSPYHPNSNNSTPAGTSSHDTSSAAEISSAAKAGIAIAITILILALVASLMLLLRQRRRQKNAESLALSHEVAMFARLGKTKWTGLHELAGDAPEIREMDARPLSVRKSRYDFD